MSSSLPYDPPPPTGKLKDPSWKAHPKWTEVMQVDKSVQEVISDLDVRLNKVLAKQEREYLGNYS
jgi:hypothetical protein